MNITDEPPRANKTDAGNGSKAICRVSNVLPSPSPDPRRSALLAQPGILPMNNSSRSQIARKFIVCALCLVAVAFAFWAAWDFTEPRIAESLPQLSWRHGTPLMQSIAVKTLMKQIKPGMSYEQVLNIVGPGSLDWPKQKERKLAPEDTVSFNVRSWYHNGVDVSFRDGRVVATFYYD